MMIAIALIAFAQASAAQPRVNKVDAVRPCVGCVPAHATARLVDEYYACVVQQKAKRDIADRFLKMPWGSSERDKLGVSLQDYDCLGQVGGFEMNMKQASIPAWLYPALYRWRFSRHNPGPVSDLPPPIAADEFAGPPGILPPDWSVRRQIGNCILLTNVTAAHQFIMTKPWTQQEDQAIGAIAAALSSCLPAGQTISFKRESLRGMIGEALYKLEVQRSQETANVKPAILTGKSN